MAYAVTNPPSMVNQRLGSNPVIWVYVSTDAIADVDDANYFSNAADLGMQRNDIIYVVNTTGNLVSVGQIGAIATDGKAGATTAFTAVP